MSTSPARYQEPRQHTGHPRALISLAEPLDTVAVPTHDRTVIVKPNRDRRTERHEAIRREILDAAWDAAHESSIAGLTLRDIATRVGMQQPSLYSHFASKQAIYDGMLEQLRGMGITGDEDADIYTALLGGLVNQQLANDPGGRRWRRLIPRVMNMYADDLGLP